MSPTRVEFLQRVREAVARKAMYVCSNPACLRLTGFVTSNGRPRAIAQAAHIAPASARGPRHDDPAVGPDGAAISHGDEVNAIWLCQACHTLIDADPYAYPSDLLRRWKTDHEQRMTGLLNLDLERALRALGEVRQYDEVAVDLLAWLDAHRFMSDSALYENPEYVLLAVAAFKSKMAQVSGFAMNQSLPLRKAADAITDAVLHFMREMHEIPLKLPDLWKTPNATEKFTTELNRMRLTVLGALIPLAEEQDFIFRNIPAGYLEDARKPEWQLPN